VTPEERTHAMELADQLMADIELDTLPLDKLLLKGARLARLVGDDRFSEWIGKELHGYGEKDLDGEHWKRTKRATATSERVYAGAVLIASTTAPLEEELRNFQLPATAGEYATTVLQRAMDHKKSLRNSVVKYKGIVVAVRVILHEYVSKHFYLLRFSGRQDDMFEEAKANIDRVLEGLPGEGLSKLDSAYVNIASGDPESIAGAMNSLRRLIDSVADALYPAVEESRTDGQGNQIKLGKQQRLNRIKAYVDDNVDSKGRGDRLKRSIGDTYARVSNGVHADVAASEAVHLFLSTYVLLGEIISLSDQS
jgi:hypothetical protein